MEDMAGAIERSAMNEHGVLPEVDGLMDDIQFSPRTQVAEEFFMFS